MSDTTPTDVYKRAIDAWGERTQLRMLQEECCELAAAVNHYARRRIAPSDLAGEIADVEIMCAQARLIVGDDLVETAKRAKLARLAGRLPTRGAR